MAKETAKPTIKTCEREPSKFTAIYADGAVHPYAFRTKEDACAALGVTLDQVNDQTKGAK